MMKYTCPVCGFNELNKAPADYSICPCCRTEFGVSDYDWSHEELREDWIARGAKWGSQRWPQPHCWNAAKQLRNIGYIFSLADTQKMGEVKSKVEA